MLPSGMSYDYLPRGTPVYAPVAPPSPLQQWIQSDTHQPGGPFSLGSCVKICHMSGHEVAPYNGLIGDIVQVHTVENWDGTSDLLFDVRCPLDQVDRWYPHQVRDKPHGRIPPSEIAANAPPHNRQVLGPQMMTGMSGRDHGFDPVGLSTIRDPPKYMMMTRLPTEKLEPLEHRGSGRPRDPNDPHGIEVLPPIVRPPIWGPPAPPGTMEQPPFMGPPGSLGPWGKGKGRGRPPRMYEDEDRDGISPVQALLGVAAINEIFD